MRSAPPRFATAMLLAPALNLAGVLRPIEISHDLRIPAIALRECAHSRGSYRAAACQRRLCPKASRAYPYWFGSDGRRPRRFPRSPVLPFVSLEAQRSLQGAQSDVDDGANGNVFLHVPSSLSFGAIVSIRETGGPSQLRSAHIGRTAEGLSNWLLSDDHCYGLSALVMADSSEARL